MIYPKEIQYSREEKNSSLSSLPSSRVVATTSGVMGPWPSTLYACTTTLYLVNFFKFVNWYCVPGIDILARPRATLAVEIRLSTVLYVY